MRHFAAPSPSPGTPATRQRLDAVGTPAPAPCEADKTSPSTSEPSAASIRRREAARPTGPSLSATTPFTAPLRNASSIAHATSSGRRSPETTNSRPGAIP